MSDEADNGGLIPGLRPRTPSARAHQRAKIAVAVWLALAALALIFIDRAHAEVQGDPKPITWKRCSTTIATGGTAQSLSLGSGPLRGFFLQNPTAATESLFFDPSGTASTTSGTSGELAAGASLSTGPGTIFFGNAISVNAVTSAHAFVCYYGQ
jgi:hypothetical protein